MVVMNEKDRIREIFDNWYYKGFSTTNQKNDLNTYSKTALFNEYLKWDVFLEVLNKNKPDLPNYKILDAGCGNGNTLRRLIEFGADPINCYGIDVSSDAINFAKYHSPATVNYRQGFIDRTGHEDESFDLIFCLGVLIHILDDEYIRKITDEFYRVAKQNALLIVTVSDSDLNPGWGNLSHTTRNFSVSQKELEKLFPKFNCTGVYKTYNDEYPPQIKLSEVLGYIEKEQLQTAFKTFVFKK